MSVKILVSGDVEGKFQYLFKNVKKLNKNHGPFNFLICVGDFFGKEENNFKELEILSSKEDNIPLPVYILGPNEESHVQCYPNTKDYCSINGKITYVGKSGIFTTPEGVRIAFISGLEYEEGLNPDCCFNQVDADKLLKSHHNSTIHILISSPWPKDIEKYNPVNHCPTKSSNILRNLVIKLKPKYHFSGIENIYFPRQPFCFEDPMKEIIIITRFLGLAKVSNTEQKSIYALNIDPTNEAISSHDVKFLDQYRQCYPFKSTPKIEKKFQKDKSRSNQECWFCLGSKNIEEHLIASVGELTYIALAKGGIVDDHLLIIPIEHVKSQSVASNNILKEIQTYKIALKKYYSQKNMVAIFFERYFRTVHFQLNCIPLPIDLKSKIKEVIYIKANEIGFDVTEYPRGTNCYKNFSSDENYFFMELPDMEELIIDIKNQRFPVDFGREVLIRKDILNLPERLKWTDCKKSQYEEETVINCVREQFRPFDFTLKSI